MRRMLLAVALLGALVPASARAQEQRPVIDVHIHYSQDAWGALPPPEAIKVLRPYRARGETGSWTRDPTIIQHVEARLKANTYAGLGEFHAYGADADTAVMKRMIELAKERRIFLHAHSDADAVERMFKHNPDALVLWAHSGFEQVGKVRDMVTRHKTLWADVAHRNDQAPSGKLDPTWRQLFIDFPERFMVGTDTYTPERWHYVIENARWSRQWLSDLPPDVARKIAYENGDRLFGGQP